MDWVLRAPGKMMKNKANGWVDCLVSGMLWDSDGNSVWNHTWLGKRFRGGPRQRGTFSVSVPEKDRCETGTRNSEVSGHRGVGEVVRGGGGGIGTGRTRTT